MLGLEFQAIVDDPDLDVLQPPGTGTAASDA